MPPAVTQAVFVTFAQFNVVSKEETPVGTDNGKMPTTLVPGLCTADTGIKYYPTLDHWTLRRLINFILPGNM